jgi:hypothetical protein
MIFQKKPFIIKKSQDASLADFYISYQSVNSSKMHTSKSHQIISSLKQGNDMILEIDSQLTSLPTQSESQDAFTELLNNLANLGVDYQDKQSKVKETKNFLGIPISSNKLFVTHRIIALISDKLWHEEHFQKIIPHFGVRYYIAKENTDLQKLIEVLQSSEINEDEKKDKFAFIIYDCIAFGQMGVKTSLTKAEIEQRLAL